jgi:hypothetical protein
MSWIGEIAHYEMHPSRAKAQVNCGCVEQDFIAGRYLAGESSIVDRPGFDSFDLYGNFLDVCAGPLDARDFAKPGV